MRISDHMKDCPCCGEGWLSVDSKKRGTCDSDGYWEYWESTAYCHHCNLSITRLHKDKAAAERLAVEAWNHRYVSPYNLIGRIEEPMNLKRVDRAVVSLSGGLDSATALEIAVSTCGKDYTTAVSFSYGQKHSKELECAKAIAKWYGVKHRIIDISSVYESAQCSLLKDSDKEIPMKSYAQQIEEDGEGKVSTYVPFRNGLFLSVLAAVAQGVDPDAYTLILLGAHKDDAAGEAYADCSEDFIKNMSAAIRIGTYNMVDVQAPFVNMTKAEIVKYGLENEVPYHLTTSCYVGHEKACGKCGTCIDRKAAFRANGSVDPIEYEE